MNNPPSIPPSDPGFQLAPPADGYVAPASKFKLRKFLVSLRRFWWIPVLTLTFCIGAAIAQFFLTPPTFVSNASMWETEKLQLPEGAAFTEDPGTYFGTLSAVLRSETMKQLALKRLADSGTTKIIYNKDGTPIDVQISVLQAPRSSVFTVAASSSNPAFTPAYLNALMAVYLEYKKNVRQEVSGDTLTSISDQVSRLERDLKADQDALTDFERSNNFAVLEEENTIAGGYLAKLNTQLSDYQLQSRLLDAVALEKDSLPKGTNDFMGPLFDSLNSSGSSSSSSSTTGSQSAEQQIVLLKLEREKLSKYLRPAHPKIVKLDADIERSQKLIDFYHQQNRDQIATARQALKIKMVAVEKSIKEWEDKVSDANLRIATADRLKVNVSRNQTLYDRLVSLLQNVDISRNIDQDTLAILEPASPAKRSYTEAASSLTLAVFGGLAIGLGIIFLISMRDDRFASVVEVTDHFGDAVVGQVPEISGLPGTVPLALLEKNDDRHMYAESYRNLRSALLFLAVEGERPKVLLITSAVPNEGKSTIATNLARAMALGGSRVLLVDGDLRKGRLHDLLGLQSSPGLAESLRQPDDLDKFIQTDSLSNFAFLSRGEILDNPGDLFLSPALDQIFNRLREQFDHVIIDSGPVFASDDATTLAPKVDGTLFVVRSRFSSARAVREALELLNQRQVKVLGLVLNRANASVRSYYYYKYNEYYPSDKTA
ncbi:MAG: polysaccharide biosynthesis tyrosine autokinase [Limisphaerales bacterium]